MKITSQQVGTGKLGNAVYSKVAGECIARQYNPNVSNPSTEAQVEQRSSFKLLSQLSATLKQYIAIRKDGLKSARNQFMALNKANVRNDGEIASINLNKVQITKSNRGLEDFSADRQSGTKIVVAMGSDVTAVVDRIVYAAYIKQDDGSLVAHDSKVVAIPGASGTFEGELKFTDKAVVIYAYGVKIMTGGAATAFGNMIAPTAEQVAKLITTSTETANGTTLTKTKGLTMLVGENTGDSDAEEHFLVSVSASGNGSVSGGGRFVAGQLCTLTAVPDAEASFVAWHRGSAAGEILSTNASYSFEVQNDIVIVGVFQGGPTINHTISVSANPNGAGTVSGGGSKEEGSSCTVVATPAAGKAFQNWTEGGNVVSTSSSYTFTVDRDRTLVANFAEAPSDPFNNVTLDGAAFNADQTDVSKTGGVIAGTLGTLNVNKVGLIAKTTKPNVGDVTTSLMRAQSASQGQTFTLGTAQLQANTKYWLVAAYDDDQEIAIRAVYDYSITTGA